MDSIQDVKNRISSIESTRQITQSMRLVSTAKMKKTRTRMEDNRRFIEESKRLANVALSNMDGATRPKKISNTAAVIVVGGDRGLCGGYNVNLGRTTSTLAKTLGDIRIITIGAKAKAYCRRRLNKKLTHSFTGVSENPFYADATKVAAIVMDWYHKNEVGEVYIVYTRFESMLSQTAVWSRLLPLELSGEQEKSVVCEPGGMAYLDNVTPFYLSSVLYGAMLEASACEQSARVSSMDAAVKNADEMIESLTLLYNQARQGAITQEIIEIAGGAANLLL